MQQRKRKHHQTLTVRTALTAIQKFLKGDSSLQSTPVSTAKPLESDTTVEIEVIGEKVLPSGIFATFLKPKVWHIMTDPTYNVELRLMKNAVMYDGKFYTMEQVLRMNLADYWTLIPEIVKEWEKTQRFIKGK